jgi:hypothetical protein
MQHQDELVASYMTVLNESNESEVKGAPKPSKDPVFGPFKKGNDADENVDLDKPSDDKELSSNVKEGEPKKLKESKNTFKNPFDELYNKIVSENSFGFSTEDENEIEPSDEGDAFGGGSDDLGGEGLGEIQDDLDSDFGGEEGLDDELGGDIEDLDGLEGGEEVDLGVLVSTLKDVLSQLEKIVGEEEGEEEEIDDIEDLDDEDEDGGEESEEGEEESEEESEDEEDGQKNPFGEGFKAKQWEKENKGKKKGKKGLKGKFEKFEKGRGNKDVAEEAVKITGLKKGVNIAPFKGNIKPLQNKKAEVTNNAFKAKKGKAQTPSTGKGHDGVPSKLSPTAGHNLMKASSHTVSGAVKAGKGVFDQ